MKNKSIPEIRFKEFTQEWKEYKLSDVTKRVRGNDGRMDLPTLTISASLGWLDQRDRFSANIAGKEQENYTLLSKGQLSYNHGNSKLAKYGVVFELRTYEEALVPRVYHSFETTSEASASFIEYMFATKIPDQELAKLVSSGARMDGLLNINYEEFVGIKINLPRIEEQNKIVSLLDLLKNNIFLQEQELETLKQIKKGFLQKMIPREGKSLPEIRFPGFTGNWEQQNLGNVTTKIGSGKTPKGGSSVYTQFGIPFLRSQNVYEDRVDFSEIVYISEIIDNEMANSRVQKNDILLNITGASIGRSAVYKYSKVANVNQHVCIIRPIPEIDPHFVQLNIASTKGQKQIDINQAGGGREGLNFQQISKMKFFFPPHKDEQTKIGNFFKKLDEMIALQQQELEALQQTKKAFLQKMFV